MANHQITRAMRIVKGLTEVSVQTVRPAVTSIDVMNVENLVTEHTSVGKGKTTAADKDNHPHKVNHLHQQPSKIK